MPSRISYLVGVETHSHPLFSSKHGCARAYDPEPTQFCVASDTRLLSADNHPQLSQGGNIDFLRNQALLFGYAIVGAIAMSAALAIIAKIWNALTSIDEWEELRKGNMAVAVVLASVIIGFSAVVCFANLPGQ